MGKLERATQQDAKREIVIHLIYRLITSKDHGNKREGQCAHSASCHLHVLCLCGSGVGVRFADEC